MTEDPTAGELREFAQSFAMLARRAHELLAAGDGEPISELALDHLDIESDSMASVGQSIPSVERPNLQLAIDELVDSSGSVIGIPPEVAHYGGFSLAALVAGAFRGPSTTVPPAFDDLAIDVDEHLRCIRAGLWLTEFEGSRVVIGVHPAERSGPGSPDLRLDVIAADESVAASVLEWLADARNRFNVYRGKVLSFSFSEYGEFGISFMARPETTAADVVLPAKDIESIRRHTVGIADHAEALREAGQHLKRGLLLYGPPGTGKTHTIGHLMHEMAERTVVILHGPSVGALGQAAAIVRSLPPSMLVIEDIDLIAAERSMHPMGGGGLMFQLLNEMDGLGKTDDVIFVLTTNRLELLEPALAARPGRIDHAVEIGLPTEEARRRLFEVYLRDVDHELGALDDAIARTEGVTGAFVKELIRRAVSTAIIADDTTVTDAHLDTALTEMLDAATPVHAAMLGGPGADSVPPMPGVPVVQAGFRLH